MAAILTAYHCFSQYLVDNAKRVLQNKLNQLPHSASFHYPVSYPVHVLICHPTTTADLDHSVAEHVVYLSVRYSDCWPQLRAFHSHLYKYQQTFKKPLVIVREVTERFQREKRLAADNGIG